MKKVKKHFNKFITGLLSGVLTLLGFSACGSEDDDMPLMYGVRPYDFELKGKVVDKADKETPIKGIQVVSYHIYEGKEYTNGADTLLTDANGEFILEDPYTHVTYRIIYEDIDGEANGGEFKKDTLDVDLTKLTSNDWIYFSKEKKYQYNVTFEMEKKEAAQEEE